METKRIPADFFECTKVVTAKVKREKEALKSQPCVRAIFMNAITKAALNGADYIILGTTDTMDMSDDEIDALKMAGFTVTVCNTEKNAEGRRTWEISVHWGE